jgi:tetratricopeptide (TPR) repeat protein
MLRQFHVNLNSDSQNWRWAFWLLLVAFLSLAWLAYAPGLRGAFLFDDFANLPALGAFGVVDNWGAFWRYITFGTADPTGRPIALLSFLVDANTWPADPYPFKRSSLILHLINGVLLALLLRRLGKALPGISNLRADLAAALGAALWLLHPLMVSTTLYVVQREAMLPATFMLLGLLGYLRGRELACAGRQRGVWLAGGAIVATTALAILSKANGALLPLLAWLVEAVMCNKQPIADVRSARGFRHMRALVLVLPSVLLLAYLGYLCYSGFVYGINDIRPWTLGERLLTEARIVVDYLGLLMLPRAYTAGLFNDAYPLSTSLWQPATTLPCILVLLGLALGAVALRKRHPALALAVLFFLAAHLMESSVIALELYYEHRNYIPAMLLFWPLALWLCRGASANPKSADNLRSLRIALAIALPLMLAGFTWSRAQLWGMPHEQALIWARMNPASPRAQAYAAQLEMARGENEAAAKRLQSQQANHPNDTQIALNLIGAHCALGRLSAIDLEHARHALANEPNTGRLGYEWFARSLPVAVKGSCPGLDLTVLDELLQAAATNLRAQKIPGRRQDVLHMRGRIALLRGDADLALGYFNQALQADLRPGAALNQAATLASAGHYELALNHLDLLEQLWDTAQADGFNMPAIHRWVLQKQEYWPREIVHLRQLLKADQDSVANPPAQQEGE